jgi:polysaccharide biosynthesis protein PslG
MKERRKQRLAAGSCAILLMVSSACSGMAPRPEPRPPVDAGLVAEGQPVTAETGRAVPNGPWGVGFSGGANTRDVFPRLARIGVQWARAFPEWAGLEPERGRFQWDAADQLVTDARRNGIGLLGVFLYFAPWASQRPPDTRAFPIGNLDDWRNYVRASMLRYRHEIREWEVWNEPNSPAFNRGGTPKDYADLVRVAHEEAKAIDPGIKVGITCASFDLGYLDRVIQAGAADHFDFVAVHPYEATAFLDGNEAEFLSMAESLRSLLAKHGQDRAMPLWITEIGASTTDLAELESQQVEHLLKVYLLALAQGFDRIFWFEASGPLYGERHFGILRPDLSPRPAFLGYATLTSLLGPHPRPIGWLELPAGSLGFMFEGESGPVLATWSSRASASIEFKHDIRVTDATGGTRELPAGNLELTRSPAFVRDLPAELVATARRNAPRQFPWTTAISKTKSVFCRLGPANTCLGMTQIELADSSQFDGASVAAMSQGVEYRTTQKAKGQYYLYFDVASAFAGVAPTKLEISVVARRPHPGNLAGMQMTYESLEGYRDVEYWQIPEGDGWHTHTWRVNNASFANRWHWNFRLNTVPSPDDVWVREVRVRRPRSGH